jgi:hypothetical protein
MRMVHAASGSSLGLKRKAMGVKPGFLVMVNFYDDKSNLRDLLQYFQCGRPY